MAIQFCFAALACFVVVSAPGWVVLGQLQLAIDLVIACAPAASIGLYVISGVILDIIGISGLTVLLCVSVLLALLVGTSLRLLFRHTPSWSQEGSSQGRPTCLLPFCICALFSLATIYFIFLQPAESLDSFVQYDDNVTHLGLIASMVNGGSCSIFSTTNYPASLPPEQIPFFNAAFYPNGWHIVTALSSLISGAAVPIAENAVNVVFVAVLFPIGCSALLMRLFPEYRAMGIIAGIVCLASSAFPLRMLTVHGPFPNVAAFCLIPEVCLLFITALPTGRTDQAVSGRHLFSFLLAALGGAVTHPNLVFSCVLLLSPYLICGVIPHWASRQTGLFKSGRIALALQASACALIAVVWVALQQTSLFSSVANYVWQFAQAPGDTLASVLNAGYFVGIPQYLLALLIALGFGRCFRERRHRWIALSYVLVAFIYVCGLTLDFETRKLFTGYWYNDPERTAALLAIAAVPLSALGFQWVASLISRGFGILFRRPAIPSVITGALALVLGLPFANINYSLDPSPLSDTPESAFRFSENQVKGVYSFADGNPYTQAERDFVRRALECIPPGSLVINFPFDGSVFSYASEGMNVYYKSCRPSKETNESRIIRTSLRTIASNDAVLDAVRRTGARYVLVLDSGDLLSAKTDTYTPLATYYEGEWDGLRIDSSTPGFTCILSEGQLALYEIAALAE
ncbi:DUF6541 family protein [Olsenella profusa]|uniref:ATP-binding protein n=1 Tax=Olsenella profusa TaxID=138595 RepID=A0ABS2F2N9_9ACTN|nr:DUF6541 family protein [Olsenella profusa]MBM6774813.1 hypothetical protein [Olsenella profusa]